MSIWQYAKEAAKIVANWPKERQTTLDVVKEVPTDRASVVKQLTLPRNKL